MLLLQCGKIASPCKCRDFWICNKKKAHPQSEEDVLFILYIIVPPQAKDLLLGNQQRWERTGDLLYIEQ